MFPSDPDGTLPDVLPGTPWTPPEIAATALVPAAGLVASVAVAAAIKRRVAQR
jgi:hypothetical protein